MHSPHWDGRPRWAPRGKWRAARLVEVEPAQPLRSARVTQFSQSARLDLANALARHTDLATNRGERFVGVAGEAEAAFDDSSFARRQRQQRVADLLGQQALFSRRLEVDRIVVGHDV